MILDEILANKRIEVAARREAVPMSVLERRVAHAGPPRGFAAALHAPGLSIISEIKRRSPSGGELRPGASAADLAHLYATNGAAALSVLTDLRYFGGSDSDLVDARGACSLPVLRKDFVVDIYQVVEARAMGADAILLVVRSLESHELPRLLRAAEDLGMDALVEAHTHDELSRALDAGATLVGVNNRDLDTLVTDPGLAIRLRPSVPARVTYIAESGIRQRDQVRELAQAGVDALLVGEALLTDVDPGARLRQFVAAGSAASVA